MRPVKTPERPIEGRMGRGYRGEVDVTPVIDTTVHPWSPRMWASTHHIADAPLEGCPPAIVRCALNGRPLR